MQDLVREITSLWQTDELRRRKPTPMDEARGGFNIVEQSLWSALPSFHRRLRRASAQRALAHNARERTARPTRPGNSFL